MNFATELALVLVGVFALLQTGSALKCWDCDSSNNNMCGDPMNVTQHQSLFHQRDCESSVANLYQSAKPICRKIVRKANGERIIVRACSLPNSDEVGIKDGACSKTAMGNTNLVESCHICSTDLCNSAGSASALQALYAGALVFLAYNYFVTKNAC